jgi:hypothetical protein
MRTSRWRGLYDGGTGRNLKVKCFCRFCDRENLHGLRYPPTGPMSEVRQNTL